MKKRICKAIILAIMLAFSLSSCSYAEEKYRDADANIGYTRMSLASFSYIEESSLYKNGDPGVKTSGFLNVDSYSINNQLSAVERAKNECTIEYNSVSEYYDSETKMWRVDFQTLSQEQEIAAPGCGQSVYLDSNGITHLIVYGE